MVFLDGFGMCYYIDDFSQYENISYYSNMIFLFD